MGGTNNGTIEDASQELSQMHLDGRQCTANGVVEISKQESFKTNISTADANSKTTSNASFLQDDEEDGQQEGAAPKGASEATKKKKKKSKSKKKKESVEQTNPPSIPITELFRSGDFPEAEIQEYKDDNVWRTTSEEKRELERLEKPMYNSVRRAAEVHRQVRKYMRSIIKPGMLMTDLCETLENTVRKLIPEDGLQSGIAFPTGCSLNWVAAHWTPNSGDKTVLQYDDVMKLDFGTHVDGLIVDCAFTVAFNPMFDPLLEASREATNARVKESGIDVRLCDVGAAIQEVMESYELKLMGRHFKANRITDHSREEALGNKPLHITERYWEEFVDYNLSEQFQASLSGNRKIGARQVVSHKSRSRSYAEWAHEYAQEHDGRPPGRVALYISTHRPISGSSSSNSVTSNCGTNASTPFGTDQSSHGTFSSIIGDTNVDIEATRTQANDNRRTHPHLNHVKAATYRVPSMPVQAPLQAIFY